jgi:hypothetical protein
MAIIAGSDIVRDSGAAHWYRVASVGLAVAGLLCFALLAVDSVTPAIGVLAVGALERGSVYSIIVGQMFTAVFLVRSARHTVSGV